MKKLKCLLMILILLQTQQMKQFMMKQFMMMNFDEDMDKLEVIFEDVQSIHDIKLYDLLDVYDMLLDRIKIFDYLNNKHKRQIDEHHRDYFDVNVANGIIEEIKNEIKNKLQDRKQNISQEKKNCFRLANQLHMENELENLMREEKYIEKLLITF